MNVFISLSLTSLVSLFIGHVISYNIERYFYIFRFMTTLDLHRAASLYGQMKMVPHPEQLHCHVATNATLLGIQPLVAL
jgi:hypothetical protein